MIIDARTPLTKYENSTIEYKSLKKAVGKSTDLKDLAKTCVCLANTQGGYLFIVAICVSHLFETFLNFFFN